MLMAELSLLLDLLVKYNITLLPRYIHSELKEADHFSRLTDRDARTLRPTVQRMLERRALDMLRCPRISLDAFTCHQSRVTSRFASRLWHPEALGFDGTALNWAVEDVVWINPPWALLPSIIGKLASERPAAILIVPKWPTQTWWQSLLDLGGTHIPQPPPKYSAHDLHHRLTEPFLHPGLLHSGSHRVAAWDSALARAELGRDLDVGGPLIERAVDLLCRGRRPSTKKSFAVSGRDLCGFVLSLCLRSMG
jgi:hypothetical protein